MIQTSARATTTSTDVPPGTRLTRRPVRLGARVAQGLRYAFLIVLTVTVVFPLVWVAVSGLRSNVDLMLAPFALPRSISLDSYANVLIDQKFYLNIWNSLWISAATTIIVLVAGSGLGYALARLSWRPKPYVMSYIALGLLMPVHAAVITIYVYLQGAIHVLGSQVAILIPYVALRLPVSILLLAAYFSRIPGELEESAVLDGCSLGGAFWRIVIPVSAPALVVVATFTFVGVWNELLFGLIFLTYPDEQTVSVSLLRFVGSYGTDWGSVLAGIALTVIPTLIIYVLLQRRLMEGVLMGAGVEA